MANTIINYYKRITKSINRYFWSDTAVRSRPTHIKYLFVITLLTIVTCIKLYFYQAIGGQTPFLLYFGVVILCAGFGGIGPGIFATIGAGLLTSYFFLYPYNQLALDRSQAIQTFVFAMESLLLIALSGAVARASGTVRLSGERFKAMIENIHDSILVVDAKGKVLYVSPTIEKILGYTVKEFKVMELGKLIHKDDVEELRKKYLELLKNNGKSFSMECKVLNKKGEWEWIESTYTNLLQHPAIKGVVANFRNVTEKNFLEKQKDDFISIATHELKTPVTSIKAYAQILIKRFSREGDEATAAMIEKMDGQLNKLIALISDLLDVTKMEDGRLRLHEEFYNFNELITEVAEELQRITSDHTIIVNNGKDTDVFGDRERIGQVFTNLVTNAIKYSPASKDIIIETSLIDNTVKVTVEDQGVGIAKQDHEKIFERFYRVSGPKNKTFPGLGLGLYISHEIIKRQGGKIWVESEVDKGSTFCFSLPVSYKILPENNNSIE